MIHFELPFLLISSLEALGEISIPPFSVSVRSFRPDVFLIIISSPNRISFTEVFFDVTCLLLQAPLPPRISVSAMRENRPFTSGCDVWSLKCSRKHKFQLSAWQVFFYRGIRVFTIKVIIFVFIYIK